MTCAQTVQLVSSTYYLPYPIVGPPKKLLKGLLKGLVWFSCTLSKLHGRNTNKISQGVKTTKKTLLATSENETSLAKS